jgi:hypothetical protein
MYVIVKAGENTSCCYINSEGGVTKGIGGDTISSDIGGFVTTAYKFKTKAEAQFVADSLELDGAVVAGYEETMLKFLTRNEQELRNISVPMVHNLVSPKTNNAVANQFVIKTREGTYFQSYQSMIAFIDTLGHIHLSEDFEYSRTTMKYLSEFLGGTGINEIRERIKTGRIQLDIDTDGRRI